MSGGPDSLALLLLAAAALPGRVRAASVDHGLRSESAGEAAMVARSCTALDVPHETLTVAVPVGNLQRGARTARYGALAEWCDRGGLGALATGHQLDDQAETLLMRLDRGSGLAGLAGIRPRGTVPGGALPLLRPLLGWRRAELAAVVAGAGIEPACDPSNQDDRFDRARLRKALAATPWLDPVMLAQSAAHLGEAEAYIEAAIASAWGQRVSHDGGSVRFLPGDSDFEAGEIARRIVMSLGDDASRAEAAALVERLRRGENASLGGVLARAAGGAWLFGPEPPRRS